MPDRPPSLLRMGGALALLLLVAPLGSIHRAYNVWYHRQQGINLHSDPVDQAAAAAAAAAHAARSRQSQQQSDVTKTSNSNSDNSAASSPPGIKNIGSFVVNGEDMDDSISIEELLSLLGVGFGRRHHHHHHHLVMQNLGLGLRIGGAGRASDIAVVIHLIMPWILALLFGVVIPAILAVIGRIRQRRGRKYFDKLSSKEKRLFRLIQCLSRFKKTIKGEDLVDVPNLSRDGGIGGDNGGSSAEKADADDNDNDDDEETIEEDRLLIIPRAGSPLLPSHTNSQSDDSSIQTMRQVPAMCTICLDPYKAGEMVVWSSNSKCKDCFHEQCIVAWLSKRRGGSDARCPCCRQHFIDDIFRLQAGLNSK